CRQMSDLPSSLPHLDPLRLGRENTLPGSAVRTLPSGVLVNRVDPVDLLRVLDRVDVGDIDNDSLVVGANEHAFERLIGTSVDFLMGNKGRYIDEVPRQGFRHILQMVAP